MFATHTLEGAHRQLDDAILKRLTHNPIIMPVEKVRFPVGLFFIRGDRAGEGKNLAEQVVASFGYWNEDSGKYFDVIFPGWSNDQSQIAFNFQAFLNFRGQIEKMSKWKYSGGTDVVLLNYDYHFLSWNSPQSFIGKGSFAFDETIILPVEEMVREGRVKNLDALVHELVKYAKDAQYRTDESVLWSIDGKMAFDRGRNVFWNIVKETKWLKHISKFHDELQYFQVRDLRVSS